MITNYELLREYLVEFAAMTSLPNLEDHRAASKHLVGRQAQLLHLSMSFN